MPSFILIRPTVWPQYTNVTDRQRGQTGQTDRTDNGPIAYGEPFYKRSPKNGHCSSTTAFAQDHCPLCMTARAIKTYEPTCIGRPFVKRFALCYQTVVCLSVCNVGALSPNGWTDQDETWHAGRPRPWPHCVNGDPAPVLQRGTAPQCSGNPSMFGPYLLRPNGCIDQDASWCGCRPRPTRLCVRWGSRSPSQKGG